MKRFILIILTFLMCMGTTITQKEEIKDYEEPEEVKEIVATEKVQPLSYEDYSQLYTLQTDLRKSDEDIVELSQEDAELLMKIAVHETGDLGAESQYLVMMVVLNRVRDENFPNTVSEVLYQKTVVDGKTCYQFLPENQLIKMQPNSDSHIALAMVEQGIDESQGAIYFEASTNGGQSWHRKNKEFLFEAYGQRYYR